jgi:hypothetical protein
MVDRQQSVGFAAAEGGLQLDDRLATLPIEALRDLREQHAHALSDEGALEKGDGIAIFARGPARAHGREVGGETRRSQ